MENLECRIVRWKLEAMYANFTVENIDKTRKEVNNHLLYCAECRAYFLRTWEEKAKELGK